MSSTDMQANTLTLEEAKLLIKQQQSAHKLIAGFYQNLLQMFDTIATACGHEFKFWAPKHNGRPVGTTGNPSLSPVWTMLPFYSAMLAYIKEKNNLHANVGDSIIRFDLYFDSAYTGNNPSPLDLKSNTACVNIVLYRCIHEDKDKNIYQLYNKFAVPSEIKNQSHTWKKADDTLEIAVIIVDLSDFIFAPDEIQRMINTAFEDNGIKDKL